VLLLFGSDGDEGVSRVIPSTVMEDPGGTSSSMMQPPLLPLRGVLLSMVLI